MILNNTLDKTEEFRQIMDDDKKPVEGVTPSGSETDQGDKTSSVQVAATVPDTEAAIENPEKEVVIDVTLDEKDPKKTYQTLRQIADEATRGQKETERQLKELQQKLTEKEQKDAEAKGEFEKLYRETLASQIRIQTEKEALETQLQSVQKETTKANKPLIDAFNSMLDEKMEDWDDDAKAYVDPAEKVSAVDRYAQYLKIKPLAQKAKAATKPVTPGAGPTPRDARENNNNGNNEDGNQSIINNLRRLHGFAG